MDDDTEIHSESTITDSSGTVYRLHHVEYSVLSDWDIFDGEWRVGFAHCLKNEATLTLGDIKLEAAFVKPTSQLERWARKLLGIPHPSENYRQRGLGSALLKVIIQWAKARGFTRIEGQISTVDTQPNPGLLDWYSRFGFTFSAYPSPGKLIGKISMAL